MGAAAYLIITNVPVHEWHAGIRELPQLIGRGAAAQIRIPPEFTSVSRRHAEVWGDRRGLSLRDVGSSGGTFVNGVRLETRRQYQISVGDRIWLGGLELDVIRSLDPHVHVMAETDDVDADGIRDTANIERQRKTTEVPPDFLLQTLTHAEQEVVLWMSRGFTHPDQVSAKLFRSPHTVRTQLNSIFRKLGVHSRDELLGWLKRANISDDSEIVPTTPPSP